jgi:2-oxoglutarate ferredoxin oxidoreductase subunit alpha
MSILLPRVGGTFIQMEDEIAAMAAVIGASAAGAKALTATSGPGYSLKQEHIGYAAFAEIPCVIIDVQRGGPSTGLPTFPSQADVMQARWGTHGDHPAIAISPGSVKECYQLMTVAFNFAERFRMPVTFLTDEIVGHMREVVELKPEYEIVSRVKPTAPPDRYKPYEADPETLVPPMACYGEGYRFYMTGLTHAEDGFFTSVPEKVAALQQRLMDKVGRFTDELILSESAHLEDAEIAVVAYGCTARAALRAVRLARQNRVKAGLLRLITIWPFPDRLVRKLAKQVEKIIVPEMNMGQLVLEVERAAHGFAEVESLPLATSEPIPPEMILKRLRLD